MISRSIACALVIAMLGPLGSATPVEGRPAGDARIPVAAWPAPARAAGPLSNADVQRIVRALGAMPPLTARSREPGRLELALEESIELALQKNPSIRIAQLTRDALEPAMARAGGVFRPVAGGTMSPTPSGETAVGF